MKYDYKCETCEKVIEVEMQMSDDHPKFVECDSCKTLTAKRIFVSAVHIPDNFKSVGGAPSWDNRYGKFPPGVRGKYTRGGGVG